MQQSNIFQGLITALITPFKDGMIDFVSLKKILDYQLQYNVDGIIIGGSTGEGSALSFAEYKILLQEAVNITHKKIPIIGSCSASSTTSAIEIAKATESVGADGLMVSLPPYIKPTQAGIYEHFKLIHDACDLQIMIYANRGRTGIDITEETLLKLTRLERILALKDSCADLQGVLRITRVVKKGFNILSGDDELALAFNAQGAKGCVSVTSNIYPQLCSEIQSNSRQGKNDEALKIQHRLVPFYRALFAETNPIGVKYAAHHTGLCENEVRLPLLPCGENTKIQIEEAIKLFNE